VKLSDLLPEAQVCVPLRARTKTAVIDELLALLPLPDATARARVREAVLARETELSTGIGRGVAIPHGRTDAVDGHLMALGIASEGVEFDAADGRPCRIFILCVSRPRDVGIHVQLLAQMCRLLNDDRARNALATATDAAAVRAALLQHEESSCVGNPA
jgi:mannitol/fructose-specific phosphotransferase system IIA component (Ntr-type)